MRAGAIVPRREHDIKDQSSETEERERERSRERERDGQRIERIERKIVAGEEGRGVYRIRRKFLIINLGREMS
jgi:hypothetical protein